MRTGKEIAELALKGLEYGVIDAERWISLDSKNAVSKEMCFLSSAIVGLNDGDFEKSLNDFDAIWDTSPEGTKVCAKLLDISSSMAAEMSMKNRITGSIKKLAEKYGATITES